MSIIIIVSKTATDHLNIYLYIHEYPPTSRDVIVEDPCAVWAQATRKCTKCSVTIAVGIPILLFYFISLIDRSHDNNTISFTLSNLRNMFIWEFDGECALFAFIDYCDVITHAWASYQTRKIAGCACAGNAGNVYPATDFKGNPQLAISTCITARASRTCRDACRDLWSAVAGKTFPAFPAHAQPAILRIW